MNAIFQTVYAVLVNYLYDNKTHNADSVYKDDLHHEVYNTSELYIYNDTAARDLQEDDRVFDWIETVKQYEQSNFGKVYCDFSSPADTANHICYILGEALLGWLDARIDFDTYCKDADGDTTDYITDWEGLEAAIMERLPDEEAADKVLTDIWYSMD